MIIKTKYILILILAGLFANASAQNSQVLYFMNLPQNHLLNPALRPSNSFYIGMPGLNLNINNNLVNFSDVFINSSTSDSVFTFLNPKYNITDFLDKVKDKNSIEPEVTLQLFGLGFSAGKDLYVFLDVNERIDGNIVFPGDLFKLALTGNSSFVGSEADLSSFRAEIKYYREVGLGFSKKFTNKLRLGMKGKLLFGIADASIVNNALGITVGDNYTHTFNADLVANLSFPNIVSRDASNKFSGIEFDNKRFDSNRGIIDFFSGTGNVGLGLDAGATYDINSKIVVSAAITDLGYIKWKKDVVNVKVGGKYTFSGIDLQDMFNNTKTISDVNPLQDVLDSLKNAFTITDTKDRFTTYLPFGITLGGNYIVSKNFSVGLLSYSRVIGQQFKEALTLSGNLNLGNAFSTSLTYTIANHRADNFGAGLAFRPGIFQFYLVADRVPTMINNIKVSGSTISIPANLNTINFRFGVNLCFGNNVKKKNDKPMMTVE